MVKDLGRLDWEIKNDGKKMDNILDKITKLSQLASETSCAAFVIQHVKSTGKFKVVFNNKFGSSKKTKPEDFEKAIDNGIEFLLKNRKETDIKNHFKL